VELAQYQYLFSSADSYVESPESSKVVLVCMDGEKSLKQISGLYKTRIAFLRNEIRKIDKRSATETQRKKLVRVAVGV
jgi:50S ribosomal subunit-associated GTPase HflX